MSHSASDAPLTDFAPMDAAADGPERPFTLADLAVVIPTLNAAQFVRPVIQALREQELDTSQVYILDSASTDGSDQLWRDAGCTVIGVQRHEFDHGGTRNLGLEHAAAFPLLLFMTQDALPCGENMLRALIAPFASDDVAIVCGRQLPRDGAGPIEAHARGYNYPAISSRRRLEDAATLGIKAIFNSNSFSCYRRSALLSIGGFPSRCIMGEDVVAAAHLLSAGWSMHYAADACVKHSHGYSLAEEFTRYFDIGVFHDEARAVLQPFSKVGSQGLRFLRAEAGFLLRRAPARIPEAFLRTATKFAGYKLGSWHRRMPHSARLLLAWNKGHFRAGRAGGA